MSQTTEELWQNWPQIEEIDPLLERGVDGMIRIRPFHADFRSFEGKETTVELTSAGVWLIVKTRDDYYVLLTEQADRPLIDGFKPLEIPSGSVAAGDLDIAATCRRELHEETGVRIDRLIPLAVAIKDGGVVDIHLPPSNLQGLLGVNLGEIHWGKKHKGGMIFVGFTSLDSLMQPF